MRHKRRQYATHNVYFNVDMHMRVYVCMPLLLVVSTHYYDKCHRTVKSRRHAIKCNAMRLITPGMQCSNCSPLISVGFLVTGRCLLR